MKTLVGIWIYLIFQLIPIQGFAYSEQEACQDKWKSCMRICNPKDRDCAQSCHVTYQACSGISQSTEKPK